MELFNQKRGLPQAWPALCAGILLSGVGVAFNVSHGWHLGGSDTLRCIGMAGVFLGCIALKDSSIGLLAQAVKAGRYGIAVLCLFGFTIGAIGSFMAAFGSASEGREEKSDPRAAQKQAFDTAVKTEKDGERRLAELGRTLPVAQAKAAVSSALANVEPGIAKRTAGCTNFPTQNVGPRVQATNLSACQSVIKASAAVAVAEEAETIRDKVASARETIAKGAPKSADPMVDGIASLWKRFTGENGQIDVGSILSLLIAAIVEIGAPIAWAIWMLSSLATISGSATVAPSIAAEPEATFAAAKMTALANVDQSPLAAMFAGELPDDPTPPKPRKRKPIERLPENVVSIADHPVRKALQANGGSVSSNRELARLMGVCDGEASKRWQEVADQLNVQRDGKRLRIALR